MRISELDGKAYLGAEGVGENSYMILNYKEADPVVEPSGNEGEDTGENTDTPVETVPPITYKVALDEIGRKLISDLHIVTFDRSNGNKLNTITAGENSYTTNTYIGQFMTDNDRATLNKVQAGYADTGTWDTYYVKSVTNTDGTIAVIHAQFSPSLTLTDGTADNAPKIKTTVNGNESSDITLTKATTGVYGVTKLSNDINSTSEVLAATPKAVKSALESLDITQITNTAGKTVATIDEADGKVSATFQDISILSSQISDKGTANCVATLDANGHVPSSQLPSYVDDVIEGTLSTFPETGETGKIYVDTTTNTSYRWSGTQYTKVASDLSLGTTSSTAYRGDYGAAAYAHGVTNKGSAFASGLYKITTNSEGHVTAATAVGKADITSLGIPGSDTTYSIETAASGGTTASLVSTGEKYTWNAKLDANQGSGNAGKYMKVGNDGALAPADLDELPAVTSSDNGKFLCVVDGVWTAKQMQTWQGGSF